jgi:rare lipoprotein A
MGLIRSVSAASKAVLAIFIAGSALTCGGPAHATSNQGAVSPPKLDVSGGARVGKASFYAKGFVGRRMADGTRMDPSKDNAASKTLPLGTTAKVTNLATGQSAIVTIKDRGPYVKGRIVDLTPTTARKVGITPSQGLATVEVAPLSVPLPNGTVKLGDAARAELFR